MYLVINATALSSLFLRHHRVAYTCPGFAASSAPIWALRRREPTKHRRGFSTHTNHPRTLRPALVPLPIPTIRDSIAFLTIPRLLVGRYWLDVNHTHTDNRKIYTSQQFQWVCASLGIALVHTKRYDPSAKGKIERFFLSVRQRFLSTLDYEGLTLDSLNQSFLAWLERDYNSFFGLLLLFSRLFKFQGSRVEVRFDPDDLSEILIYDEGVEVAGIPDRLQLSCTSPWWFPWKGVNRLSCRGRVSFCKLTPPPFVTL